MEIRIRTFGLFGRVVAGILAAAFLLPTFSFVVAKDIHTSTPLAGFDLDGNYHRLGGSRGCKATVVVFLGTQCPISNGCIPRVVKLAEEYRELGAEFYGIVSDPSVTRKAAVEHKAKYRLRIPVLFDASGELQRRLHPTHVPHAFVLDKNQEVIYQGAIDDEYAKLGRKKLRVGHQYLRDAVSAVMLGKPVAVSETKPIGCLIEADESRNSSSVTYAREIAPIVLARCASCHRSGEVAPFPLLTYDDAKSHAKQIALVTQKRLMPPWKAEAGFGEFHNDRRLTDREIALLQKWVAAGAPEGDRDDLPPTPKFVEGWQLGKPDLILEMPEEFEVPADGPDVYRHFVIPSGVTETRLISAIEFRPSTPAVVHHAFLYFDLHGAARKLDADDPGPGYSRFGGPGFQPDGGLGGWAPGGIPERLPDGLARPMWGGADVVMQLHYRPSGKPERDRSKLGIYFAPDNVRKYTTDAMVANVDLHIPAGAKRHRHTATYTLPVDTTVLDVTPHMHVLGREMKVQATKPDGTVVPLIWVKDWDFNWQEHYRLAEPIRLPKGTRVDSEAYFDNSDENPLNPNSPPREVHWGEFSSDEMCICYLQATADDFQEFLTLVEHIDSYFNDQMQRYLKQQASRTGAEPAVPARAANKESTGRTVD